MTKTIPLFFFVFLAGLQTAPAQIPSTNAASASNPSAADPVAQVREAKSWEYGPFVNYGSGVGDRSGYKFFWAGYQLSKPLSGVEYAGIFSGQFEFGGNIMPLWQSYAPAAHYHTYNCSGTPCSLLVGGGTFRGVSLTPVILRWNFLTKSRRVQPWFQGAGGLIYTTHKFPPNFMSNPALGMDGGTCVWNFSPQGGVGVHLFTGANRSIDIGVNGVHISSASLGDRNPGINASVQVQVGYTYWK